MSIATVSKHAAAIRLARRAAPFAAALPVLVVGLAVPAAAANTGVTAAQAYERFCDNNPDLCTVTVRIWNPYFQRNFTYTCMLDAVGNRCPSGAVVIDGPYHK